MMGIGGGSLDCEDVGCRCSVKSIGGALRGGVSNRPWYSSDAYLSISGPFGGGESSNNRFRKLISSLMLSSCLAVGEISIKLEGVGGLL